MTCEWLARVQTLRRPSCAPLDGTACDSRRLRAGLGELPEGVQAAPTLVPIQRVQRHPQAQPTYHVPWQGVRPWTWDKLLSVMQLCLCLSGTALQCHDMLHNTPLTPALRNVVA